MVLVVDQLCQYLLLQVARAVSQRDGQGLGRIRARQLEPKETFQQFAELVLVLERRLLAKRQ